MGTQTVKNPDSSEEVLEESKLVVYNDDYNSFEWVIESFMTVLRVSSVTAEQLSYIIHYKGKCTVKTGSREKLKVLKDGLIDRGLSATIE